MQERDLKQIHEDLIALARHYGGGSEAEDIVQESYLKIIEKVNAGMQINRGYCFVVVKNMTITFHRQVKRSPEERMPEHFEVPEEVQEHDPRIDQINEAMKDLDWYDRKIVELYATSGKSFAALGKETKIGKDSIYRTFTKAKDEIKRRIR